MIKRTGSRRAFPNARMEGKMRVSFSKVTSPQSGALVVTALEGGKLTPSGIAVDKKSGGAVKKAIKGGKFSGSKGQTIEILAPRGTRADRILVVGLGDAAKLGRAAARSAGSAIVAKLLRSGLKTAAIAVDAVKGAQLDELELAAEIAYGAKLRSYNFDKYYKRKRADHRSSLTMFTVMTENPDEVRKAFSPLNKVADGVVLARNLVSEPGNVIYPQSLAAEALKLEKQGVTVEVLGEKKMSELGMGALLAVGQGSAQESQLIVMEWNGDPDAKGGPIAFVGKGVCFDTGGISLKGGAGMADMKFDMGGAAAVIGLMKALSGRKAKTHVVGVVGAVENMPSGDAYRPGDVITSMSGQTIEVLNTDAEGRLVLADAIHYTQTNFKPKFIIDLATLTGAIMGALGKNIAGLFSNNDELADRIFKAGQDESERVWRMPMGPEFDSQVNSKIADMRNTGSVPQGGSITAAQFIQRFVKGGATGTPWAHIDIAGVAWSTADRMAAPAGATGFGVQLLNRLVEDHYEAE